MNNIIIAIFFLAGAAIFIAFRMITKPNKKAEPSNSGLFTVEKKGEYGENLIKMILGKLPGDSEICSNVYLPKENGETTEADIIFIHETGLYVIESKYYSGKIHVSENYKEWVQHLGRNRSISFFNPIMQNNVHIKYLKKLLNSKNIKVDD